MTSRLHLATLAPFLVAIACGDDSSDDGGGAAADATAVAVATDFTTAGVASTVAIPSLDVAIDAVEGVASTDPVVRRLGGRLFVINRFGQDNVTVLDAASLELVAQISTGPGSNPHDVAVLGDTVFVAALNAPGVLVLDLTRPDEGVIDTVDLSDLDPDDGQPDCSTIAAFGQDIVAVCGVLDENFQPRGPGRVALIGGAGRDVIATTTLTQIQPFGMAQVGVDGASLLVATVEDFTSPAAGGCVERLLVTATGVESGGCLVENTALGGFASGLAPDPTADRVWMAVTSGFDPDPVGELVSVPAAGGDLERVELAGNARPVDVAMCPTGHLVLSDATRGVRVLAPEAAEELTSEPLDIGLPPVSNGLVCY